MGFMDKVKAQAEQAIVKAQQGATQAQGKIDDLQSKRAGDALVSALGSAYYAEQRSGGSAQAVTDALAALDAHVAANGPLGAPAAADAPAAPATGPVGTTFPAAGTTTPPAGTGGSFSLDDV